MTVQKEIKMIVGVESGGHFTGLGQARVPAAGAINNSLLLADTLPTPPGTHPAVQIGGTVFVSRCYTNEYIQVC